MYRISKTFTFSASHQIEGHPKCGRLHGHNYKVTVAIEGINKMNGMVIDYGEVSRIVKPLIEAFDHRHIVSYDNTKKNNPLLPVLRAEEIMAPPDLEYSTAECLAEYFYLEVRKFIRPATIRVTVQETEKTSATFPVT